MSSASCRLKCKRMKSVTPLSPPERITADSPGGGAA
jgi:hypothetical protein